jgi:hypothetical protein
MPDLLHAAARDTNPKRKRGRQTIASFTLRVSVGCLISGSAKYKVTGQPRQIEKGDGKRGRESFSGLRSGFSRTAARAE